MIEEKVKIMRLIEEGKFKEAMQEIYKKAEQNELHKFNAYYLDEVIKQLVKLTLDKDRMQDYEIEHHKKLAYVFASRL